MSSQPTNEGFGENQGPDQASVNFDISGVNAPDSIMGGTAATNFPVSPKYDANGGFSGNKPDTAQGGTGSTNFKANVQTDGSTNDRAK